MKKKFVAAGAALLATAFIGQVASAKSLEDVLKEKGVITEADYKEINKVKPLDYKLGKGMTFTSADDKFQLSIGGQLQFRYTLLDGDRSAATDFSKFELRRIKLNLNGYAFTKDLTYKVIYNLGSNLLEETYLNYKLLCSDEAQVRIGQDKVPFGRQFLTSSSANEFVDVSNATTAFVPEFDTGVNINGKVANGLAYYSVGGLGGVGQSTFRTTRDNAFAARVAVNPLGDMAYSEADLDNTQKPLVSVGSSFYLNTLNPGETNKVGFTIHLPDGLVLEELSPGPLLQHKSKPLRQSILKLPRLMQPSNGTGYLPRPSISGPRLMAPPAISPNVAKAIMRRLVIA